MTEDYAALRSVKYALTSEKFTTQTLLFKSQQTLLNLKLNHQTPLTIFGSKFPADLEYKQICYNINTIKTAMELGRTVLLLNLDELYESLYDALNQYYSYLGEDRYVDLGLGTQRVKCKVHDNFKLIVLAQKEIVYEKFPIPLINRLEKHLFSTKSLLTPEQIVQCNILEGWCQNFAENINTFGKSGNPIQTRRYLKRSLFSVFIGFTNDTIATLILRASETFSPEVTLEKIIDWCENRLLQCVSLDSVILNNNPLLLKKYLIEQEHDTLASLIRKQLSQDKTRDFFIEISTYAKNVSGANIKELSTTLFGEPEKIQNSSLEQFDSAQSFKGFLEILMIQSGHELLLIQCDYSKIGLELLACAQNIIEETFIQYKEENSVVIENKERKLTRIVLLIYLKRSWGTKIDYQRVSGFSDGFWQAFHIDELFDTNFSKVFDQILGIQHLPLSALFGNSQPKNACFILAFIFLEMLVNLQSE